MSKRTLVTGDEFYLDKDLEGSNMREQMNRFYNMYAYWSAESSRWDAERKSLVQVFDMVKDKARNERARQAAIKMYKSAIADAHIRNVWEEQVELDGEVVTLSIIQDRLTEIIRKDNEAKHNMYICQTAVDICRSCLSFDKQEMSRISSSGT